METYLSKILSMFDQVWASIVGVIKNTYIWQNVFNFTDFVNNIAAIIVSGIAIITFLRSYYLKRIKILGWHQSTNIYDGYRFGVSIQNRCLSTLAIKRVSVILDNSEEVVLFSSNTLPEDDQSKAFRSIEPFKTDVFTSNGSTTPLFEKKQFVEYKKIIFCFTHADESQTKVRYRLKKIKKNNYKTLIPKQSVFRGVKMTEHMMYIVERNNTARPRTQQIVFKNGMLDGKIGIVSNIPKENCISADAVKQFLEINNQGMTFDVYANPYYKQD